jgi:hypothetical protein
LVTIGAGWRVEAFAMRWPPVFAGAIEEKGFMVVSRLLLSVFICVVSASQLCVHVSVRKWLTG